MKSTMVKSEKDWQAEDDARTMAHYQEIMNDKARMNRAVKAAQSQAKDLNARAAAMNKVASTRNTSSRNSKKK